MQSTCQWNWNSVFGMEFLTMQAGYDEHLWRVSEEEQTTEYRNKIYDDLLGKDGHGLL